MSGDSGGYLPFSTSDLTEALGGPGRQSGSNDYGLSADQERYQRREFALRDYEDATRTMTNLWYAGQLTPIIYNWATDRLTQGYPPSIVLYSALQGRSLDGPRYLDGILRNQLDRATSWFEDRKQP